jgi:hypothetical protein
MFSVKYAMAHGGGIVVYLPFNPRKGKCVACGKVVGVDIKSTQLHHWWYAYQAKTVRENPILALDNTSELCFYCHEIADALRALLYAQPDRVAMVALCLKGEQRERFIKVIEHVLDKLKSQTMNPVLAQTLFGEKNEKI